jgi:acetate kinase
VSTLILVLNAGSSSLKFSVYDDAPEGLRLLGAGCAEGIGHARLQLLAHDGAGTPLLDRSLAGDTSHDAALTTLLGWLEQQFARHRLVAVGHRVVHGGLRYTDPVRLDDVVLAGLRRLIPLAPLHQPHNLAAVAAMARLHPALPQVACFDTAFHRTQSPVATAYALPRRLSADGLRRYGFHGLSYEYIASVLPDVLGADAAEGRVVVAHLGSGASLCAMHGRRSVATTMGFTALDGLMMARRCGSLDPGVVLYLMQEKGLGAEEIANLLYRESGLLGVSGISDDVRELRASERIEAREALDLFVYRIARELGSMAAALGGLDALVFTAGIGEHAADLRARICAGAAWLGLELDEAANAAGGPRLTRAGSRASAWMIPTDEDLVIARHVRSLIGGAAPPARQAG